MLSLLIAGSTGLVGRAALAAALADPAFTRVVTPVRRAVAVRDPRHDAPVVDFEHLDDHAPLFAVDVVACALGTTIRQAGSQQRFRQVDYEYPLAIARQARAAGARHFALVSALGANARSRVFYNRIKGQLEDALGAQGWPGLTILRPSLLLGQREEFRLGEEVARRFAWLVPGTLRPVQATDVAAVLVRAARDAAAGVRVIESADIRRLARG